ncbi:MAG: hypothetical protein AAF958_06325 [Planctomycetota bacterium]
MGEDPSNEGSVKSKLSLAKMSCRMTDKHQTVRGFVTPFRIHQICQAARMMVRHCLFCGSKRFLFLLGKKCESGSESSCAYSSHFSALFAMVFRCILAGLFLLSSPSVAPCEEVVGYLRAAWRFATNQDAFDVVVSERLYECPTTNTKQEEEKIRRRFRMRLDPKSKSLTFAKKTTFLGSDRDADRVDFDVVHYANGGLSRCVNFGTIRTLAIPSFDEALKKFSIEDPRIRPLFLHATGFNIASSKFEELLDSAVIARRRSVKILDDQVQLRWDVSSAETARDHFTRY